MVRVPVRRGGSIALDIERRVATVAGREIPVSLLDRRLAEMRHGPRARHIPPDGLGESGDLHRWVAQELVMEAVVAHEAQAAGIASGVVAGGGEALATAAARLAALITADVAVPDAETRAYYERNRDLYARPEARRVRHALFADEHAARAAAARTAAGDEPASVEELRAVQRGELAGPLEDAIFGAEVGAVVGPIRTEHGWHVVRIEEATAAFVVPYAEACAAIEKDLLLAARARAFDEWLDRRRHALVVMEPEYEHPGHPSHGVPSHRH